MNVVDFATLAVGNLRRTRVVVPKEPEKSPAEILAEALYDWANAGACRDKFLPHLDNLIAEAENEEARNMTSHPIQNYWKGRKDSLTALRSAFAKWRDKRAGAPATE